MTFKPDDWPRVKALFDAALDVDRAERPAWVASACGEDTELRRQVEVLLAGHEQAGGFFDAPVHRAFKPPPDPEVIGRTIGTYRVTAKLGAGGMGEVYAAHDTNLDRPVALKLLPTAAAADVDRLRRFRAEARAVSSLNHPHILVIHDFGDLDGRPFIVTELVEGETLRQRIARGPLAVRDAVEVAVQIAGALAAAHARGIVHRDIKPENVMVRPDGYVKVLDFGLAKLLTPSAVKEPEPTIVRTIPGLVLGTPRYMSPEQARGLDVDPRSDVWSLGVILYEMIAGWAPFQGATSADLISAVLQSEPGPIELASPDGDAVRHIVDKALRKNPVERYADTRELLADLIALKRQVESRESANVSTPRPFAIVSNNFPLQITTFVGREDDIDGVRGALTNSRLVTLTGAGGVGKTRLALTVGRELLGDFRDGAWLVDLAPLSDPLLVAATVALALGVRERPGQPVADTLCEHLLDACATLVHQLLAACADVKVLATSREALNVPGESTWRVRSLGVPEPVSAGDVGLLARAESVQLFAQRARAARPAFEVTAENAASVAHICRRLDGLPLAIELAAARVSAMSPVEIAERLDDRFRLLTGGSRLALPRQRTLEATVSWSYELLSEPERLLFDRLAIFAGGWTLDAAERVCVDEQLASIDVADLLARLVDRSLVVPDEAAKGRTRYRLLETLRQFGRDRLIASGDTTASRARHLAWAVARAESSPPLGHLPPPEIMADTDNLRVALEWACDTGAYESGLRITSTAWFGNLDERRRMWQRLLPFADRTPVEVHGKALFSAGGLAFMIGDWQWGIELMDSSAEVNAAAGNAQRTSMSLSYAGSCYWGMGDVDTALAKIEQAITVARGGRSVDALVRALLVRTWIETERDTGRAEALAIDGEAEAAPLEAVFDRGHFREVRGFIHCLRGEFERGGEVLAEALTLFENIQVNCASHILETAAAWAAMTGRFELGAEILGSADRIREETGDKPRPWERVVQELWLPKIAGSLEPDVFDKAHRRGARRGVIEALGFARRELRAGIRLP